MEYQYHQLFSWMKREWGISTNFCKYWWLFEPKTPSPLLPNLDSYPAAVGAPRSTSHHRDDGLALQILLSHLQRESIVNADIIETSKRLLLQDDGAAHGLRTSGEEIALTAWPRIQSQSQIFRYSQSFFCLKHRLLKWNTLSINMLDVYTQAVIFSANLRTKKRCEFATPSERVCFDVFRWQLFAKSNPHVLLTARAIVPQER